MPKPKEPKAGLRILGLAGPCSGILGIAVLTFLLIPSTNRMAAEIHERPPDYAAFDGRHKLILHSRGSDEVYNLHADPMETRSLRSAPPHLASFLSEISSARVGESQPAPEVPAHIEAELEALGYAQ